MDLSWLPDDGGTGHMPPSYEVIEFWRRVKRLTNFKSMMEIGFNAGHSSSIMLTLFEDIEINSCDIGMYEITERNGELVKERFGDRFNLHIFDSTKLKPEFIANKYDIMFIDGAHDYGPVTSDMKLWIESDIPYAVVDDLQNQNVKRAFNELLNNDQFVVMHSATYTAVLPHRMRDDKNIQPKQVPIKLVKKVA